MSSTTTRKSNKKLQTLVGILGEEKAILAWNAAHPDKPVADSKQAPAPSVLSEKEQLDVLVAQNGLAYTRGRVYISEALLEAQAQVFKTGSPVVVKVEGERHIKGVLVSRVDEATVSVQNLAAIH